MGRKEKSTSPEQTGPGINSCCTHSAGAAKNDIGSIIYEGGTNGENPRDQRNDSSPFLHGAN